MSRTLEEEMLRATLVLLEKNANTTTTTLPFSTLFARQLNALAYEWASQELSGDLECFAKHAGRKTVALEDVEIAARKNAKTSALIHAEANRLRSARADAAKAKRPKAGPS